MISTAGRPRRAWYINAEVRDGRLIIRADDEADPTFWFELCLCPEEMERIVSQWIAQLEDVVIEPAHPFVSD